MAEAKDILGKRILITGDVNSGKTTLTKSILDVLCCDGLSSRIVIVDMGPEIPEEIAVKKGIKGVGGKLTTGRWEDIVYLSTSLMPPRLTSKTEEEAVGKAEDNRRRIDGLFNRFRQADRDILFINDISMYLQAGHAKDLLQWIESAGTVVANGYYGQKLGTGRLSLREAEEMGRIINAFPYHVRMPDMCLEEVLNRAL